MTGRVDIPDDLAVLRPPRKYLGRDTRQGILWARRHRRKPPKRQQDPGDDSGRCVHESLSCRSGSCPHGEPSGLEHALGGPLAFWTVQAFALLPVAILFSTARRHNGFAGLHDLASGTRVVERRVKAARAGLTILAGPSQRVIVGRAGPYEVLPDAVQGWADGWRWGFDPRLRRAVWLRFSDPGDAARAVPRGEAVVRGTRLRWLAGRRLENEAWDAYEAVEGAPLSEVAHEWTDVRWWLLDLARECAATTAADRAPRSPQRVWTLASGGIKWLDDPAADAVAPADSVATDQQLLIAVAQHALGREVEPALASSVSGHPLPLGASRFFEHLLGPHGQRHG